MYHIRTVFLSVAAHVSHIETLGKVEIELYGAALPFPSQRVLDLYVNLGAVKSTASLVHVIFNICPFYRFLKGQRSFGPHGVITYGFFFGTGGKVELEVLEPEFTQHVQAEGKHPVNFIGHLVRTAENMGVILGKPPHPQQSMQHTASLITIDGAKLGPPEGQVAVRPAPVSIHQYMKGAVHGFHVKLLPVNIHG